MTETRRAHDWSEQDNRMVLVHFAHLLERKIHEKSTEHQKDTNCCQILVLQYFNETLISRQTHYTGDLQHMHNVNKHYIFKHDVFDKEFSKSTIQN